VNIFIVDWHDINIGMYLLLKPVYCHVTFVRARNIDLSLMQGFVTFETMRLSRFEEGIDEDEGTIIQHYEEIHDLVTNFARLHYEQLQEATTILELALWKAVIFHKDDKQGLTRVECRSDLDHCNSFAYWHGNFYAANVDHHLYDCVYYVTHYQNQALLHEQVISTSLPNLLWVCQML
jgi:hypothetical protein